MPEKWTGEIVKELHNNNISQNELAKEIGWTVEYVSLILNSRRNPTKAKSKMETAMQTIIDRRKENTDERKGTCSDNS